MKTTIATTGQLGPLLKRLRRDKGLSQQELGTRIGLSQERISRIESRPESVTLDQLLTVMMALDATFSVELRTAGTDTPAEPLRPRRRTMTENKQSKTPPEPETW